MTGSWWSWIWHGCNEDTLPTDGQEMLRTFPNFQESLVMKILSSKEDGNDCLTCFVTSLCRPRICYRDVTKAVYSNNAKKELKYVKENSMADFHIETLEELSSQDASV